MKNVFTSIAVSIDYDEEKKQMVQTWNGFATSVQFREAIDKSVAFALANPVRTIISDTLNQKVVAPDDADYAAAVMPKFFKSGLKAMAFVMPKSIITQLSLKHFAEGEKMDNIKYFPTIDDAKKWLLAF